MVSEMAMFCSRSPGGGLGGGASCGGSGGDGASDADAFSGGPAGLGRDAAGDRTPEEAAGEIRAL